jgi:hypothetical protein
VFMNKNTMRSIISISNHTMFTLVFAMIVTATRADD